MARFKSLAEAEAYAAEQDARIAALSATATVTLEIYSNCGQAAKSKSGGPMVCRVDKTTLKCVHGGTPKGNFGFYGFGQKPKAFWAGELTRFTSAPVVAEALALIAAHPDHFTRKVAAPAPTA